MFSSSLKDIALSLKYFNLVALGTLTAKLAIIDGVLLQKALSDFPALAEPVDVTNVRGYALQSFPITGTVSNAAGRPGLMEHWVGDTVRLWSQTGGSYPWDTSRRWQNCWNAVCYISVPGIGFAFDCDPVEEDSIDYGNELVLKSSGASSDEHATLFNITFSPQYWDGSDPMYNTSYILMDMVYTRAEHTGDGNSCPGTRFAQTCKLLPAIIDYPVQIQDTNQGVDVSTGDYKAKYAAVYAEWSDLKNQGYYRRHLKQQEKYV